MQRTGTYECMCLLDNREVRAGWQPLKDSVIALFKKHGAEVVSSRRWDERRLSYEINGQQRATYLLTYLKADTQQVAGIRRDLQFKESVLRSLLLAVEAIPESAYEPEAAFDVNAIPADDAPPQVADEGEEAGGDAEAGAEGDSNESEAASDEKGEES